MFTCKKYSPILLAGDNHAQINILKLALQKEGFRPKAAPNSKKTPLIGKYPLSILCYDYLFDTSPWLEYIKKGGVLVVFNPDNRVSRDFGLENFIGREENGSVLILDLIFCALLPFPCQ